MNMKKMIQWVLAATLIVCGASLLTACKDNDGDSGSQPKSGIAEKVVGKWLKKTLRKNGFVVSIPGDIKTIQKQAKKLHQCLVSFDYIGKMADRRCLLVFISTKEGAPVATAEILPSGKVGQFYGDERDRYNMKPDKKAQEALDAWLKKFKPKWRMTA